MTEPFFSKENQDYIFKSVQELRQGKGTVHDLIEVEYIPTPTIAEFLIEEFMKPLNISLETLAFNTSFSETNIKAILNNEIKITPEISKRLDAYFGLSELFFYRLQNDIDRRNAELHNLT